MAQKLKCYCIDTQTNPAATMSMDELQSWITSCRKFLKTNMGSFLMRSQRDEPLLVGDLHFSVYGLQGLTRPADLFVVVETDSYGHYFRKAKTRLSSGKSSLEPRWDEDFIVELEGSENLHILAYEQQAGLGNMLRRRATGLARTGPFPESFISQTSVRPSAPNHSRPGMWFPASENASE